MRSALGAGRRRIVGAAADREPRARVDRRRGRRSASGRAARRRPVVHSPGRVAQRGRVVVRRPGAAVCALTALAVGMLFGLAPAWQSTRGALAEAVSSEGRIDAARRLAAQRSGVGAGRGGGARAVRRRPAAAHPDRAARASDTGSRATEVLTAWSAFRFRRPDARAPYPTADSARRFYEAVEDEVVRMPGVRNVAWGGVLPLDGLWFGQPFAIAGDPPKPLADPRRRRLPHGQPGVFRSARRADRRRPRVHRRRHRTGAARLHRQRGVRRASTSAAGVRSGCGSCCRGCRCGDGPVPSVEIVGVVRQVKAQPAETEPMPHVYVPLAQNAWWRASLIVRPERRRRGGARRARSRRGGARRSSSVAVARMRTLATIADEATSRPRFRAVLVGAVRGAGADAGHWSACSACSPTRSSSGCASSACGSRSARAGRT